jgi:hypothetical protein
MPLPKLNTPIYETELPSNNRSIRYRPILVKEEKLMIIANESNDPKEITTAVRQILTNCILDNDVVVEDLTTFDLEYIFLNIIRRSIDDVFELKLLCPDDEKTIADVKLKIDDIKVQTNPDHKDVFEVGGLIIKMKYPKFSHFLEQNYDYSKLLDENGELLRGGDQVDQSFKMICECIDTITDQDGESYSTSDCTPEEVSEFVDTFNNSAFEKISSFFDTMPKLKHEVKFKNPETKKMCKIVLEGLPDFFG